MSILCFSIYFSHCLLDGAIQEAAKTQNIFILVRNANMNGDMYNGFLFDRRYQTRETIEHQSGPSGLVIYPGYQQFHPIIVSTSHDASPARSESPSDSSGSGFRACKQTVGGDRSQDSYRCIQRPP